MRKWEGGGSCAGEGEDESELDVHSGFIAANDQTERQGKRRWGNGGKRAVRVGSGVNQLEGAEKISRWCMKRHRSPMVQGLDWGESKKLTRSFNVPRHIGRWTSGHLPAMRNRILNISNDAASIIFQKDPKRERKTVGVPSLSCPSGCSRQSNNSWNSGQPLNIAYRRLSTIERLCFHLLPLLLAS